MAVEGPQPLNWTFIAGGAIVAFTFVKMSANNTVIACAGTTDKPIGVALEAAASGAAVPVCIAGICKVQGDADLAAGNAIGTSADAQAAAYTAADTTKYIVGTVLIDNGAAGGLITAAIDCLAPRTLA
jgi:uncharacterized protein DUF2190